MKLCWYYNLVAIMNLNMQDCFNILYQVNIYIVIYMVIFLNVYSRSIDTYLLNLCLCKKSHAEPENTTVF